MPLPYTKVFTPLDELPAQDLNDLQANDTALAAGTGLDDGAVIATKTSFGGNYTTSEVNTGFTWVGGKAIYKKTISFGALPNNTTKNVSHGISNLLYVINVEAFVHRTSDNVRRILPHVSPSTIANQFAISDMSNTQISVATGADVSSYDICFFTLYYTKTV